MILLDDNQSSCSCSRWSGPVQLGPALIMFVVYLRT